MRFITGITLTSLLVGSFIIGKKIYSKYINPYPYFTIERIITTYNDNPIYVGIFGKKDNTNVDNLKNNTFTFEGIRYGEFGDIKKLISFFKTKNKLFYNFDGDITLVLIKDDDNITVEFQKPGLYFKKQVSNLNYKSINMNSKSLDNISEFK